MTSIDELQKEIEKIQKRNKAVELDKAWEVSLTRRLFIMLATYVCIAIVMASVGVEKPYFSAVIPVIAYFLSTSSLSAIKSIWIKKHETPRKLH